MLGVDRSSFTWQHFWSSYGYSSENSLTWDDPDTGLLGFGFSHLMRFSHQKGFVDRQSYVAQYIALVLLVMGIAGTLGMDDLLAAFAAGTDLLPKLMSL